VAATGTASFLLTSIFAENRIMKKYLLVLPMAVLLVLSGCESGTIDPQHPNFVILFADDMGYGDLGVYGNPVIRTPNLDRMASEGMKFTNFYSGSPACTASRYALMTGRYPLRSGFGWVLVPSSPRGIHPDELTLAEGLKSVGYNTAIYGKWHLGTTNPIFLPLQNGFDDYLGLPYSNDMLPNKWPPMPLIEGNHTIEINPDQNLLTRRYTERAVEFIRKNSEEAFFIYLPYTMPHVPLHPGPEFEGRSRRGLYGDVVEEIDWSAGEIMRVLKEEGIEKNTLVFFTSDNGPWISMKTLGGSSGLMRDGKGSTWEGGMHEPGIAWWPETVPAGEVCMDMSSTLDLYSTLLSLAGVGIPADRKVDGRDITPHLMGDGSLADSPYFFYGPAKLHAVRLGSWKLHIHTSSQTGADYFDGKLPLLFNLDEDPSEKYDLSVQNPEKIEELLEVIRRHEEERKQLGTFWDKTPL
jgi:arylsulfatase